MRLPTEQIKTCAPFGNTKASKELLEEMTDAAKEKAGLLSISNAQVKMMK